MNEILSQPMAHILQATPVRNLMTKRILPVYADWSIAELAEFLVSNGISGAPVVDSNDKLIGVVSVTDIARGLSISDSEEDVRAGHSYYTDALDFSASDDFINNYETQESESQSVKEIMTPMIYQIDADASVQQACDAMVKNRIHRVFVSQNNKIIGVVAALDILRLISG